MQEHVSFYSFDQGLFLRMWMSSSMNYLQWTIVVTLLSPEFPKGMNFLATGLACSRSKAWIRAILM